MLVRCTQCGWIGDVEETAFNGNSNGVDYTTCIKCLDLFAIPLEESIRRSIDGVTKQALKIAYTPAGIQLVKQALEKELSELLKHLPAREGSQIRVEFIPEEPTADDKRNRVLRGVFSLVEVKS